MKKQLITLSAVLLYLLTLTQCTGPEGVLRFRFSAKPALTLSEALRKKRSPVDDTTTAPGLCTIKDQPSRVLASVAPRPNTLFSLHPGGRIFYQFDATVPDDLKTRIKQAMTEWEEKTGVLQFVNIANMSRSSVPRRPDYHIISFSVSDPSAGSSGSSTVGFSGYIGAVPTMELRAPSSSLLSTGTIRHELGHVIGLSHEMQRPDAAQHIKYREDVLMLIKEKNEQSLQYNYTPYNLRYDNNPFFELLDRPFNVNSVMMYKSCIYDENQYPDVFSHIRKSDCAIIKEKDIENISNGDVEKVQALYTRRIVIRNEYDVPMTITFHGTYNTPDGMPHSDAQIVELDPQESYFVIYSQKNDAFHSFYINDDLNGRLLALKYADVEVSSMHHSHPTIKLMFERADGSNDRITAVYASPAHPEEANVTVTKRLFTNLNSRNKLLYEPVNRISPAGGGASYILCTTTGFMASDQHSTLPSFFPDALPSLNAMVLDILRNNTRIYQEHVAPIYFILILTDGDDDSDVSSDVSSEEEELETLVVPGPGSDTEYIPNPGGTNNGLINFPTDNGTETETGVINTNITQPPVDITSLLSAAQFRDELKKRRK